jgi:hypothetical protein
MHWTWLEAVALDRVPLYRGIAVVSPAAASRAQIAVVASYRPVTSQRRKV